MKSTLLKKPNGILIEVNHTSLAYAKSLGWQEVTQEAKQEVKPRRKKAKKNG